MVPGKFFTNKRAVTMHNTVSKEAATSTNYVPKANVACHNNSRLFFSTELEIVLVYVMSVVFPLREK